MKAERLAFVKQLAEHPKLEPELSAILKELIAEIEPPPTVPTTARDLARFWGNVDKSGDCWLWTGATRHGRYGQFFIGGRNRYAHRLAYQLCVGPIPEGLLIDHKCRVRHCVNPDHLRAVTYKQNNENHGQFSNNTSGIRGVWREGKRWRGSVSHHNVKHKVGPFATIEEARAAVVALRLQLHTHNDSDK